MVTKKKKAKKKSVKVKPNDTVILPPTLTPPGKNS